MRMIIVNLDNGFLEDEQLSINIKYMRETIRKGDSFLLDTKLDKEQGEKIVKDNNIPYTYLSCYDGCIIYNKRGHVQSVLKVDDKLLDDVKQIPNHHKNVEISYISAPIENKSIVSGILIKVAKDGYTKKIKTTISKLKETYSQRYNFKDTNNDELKEIFIKPISDVSHFKPYILSKKRSTLKVIDTRKITNTTWPLKDKVYEIENDRHE